MRVKTASEGEAFAEIPGCRFDAKRLEVSGPVEVLQQYAPVTTKMRDSLEAEPPDEWKKPALEATNTLRLRGYQEDGVKRGLCLIRRRGALLLADEMGLGKTRTACAIAAALDVSPVMIVCPASVKHQWVVELAPLNKGVFVPESSDEIEEAADVGLGTTSGLDRIDFHVVSYGLADKLARALEDNFTPAQVVIWDEAHYLSDSVRRSGGKRNSSKRSDAAAAAAASALYRIALTGTPLPNRVRDMWRVLTILHGESVWGSARAFDRRYCNGRLDEFGHWDNEGSSNRDELQKRLAAVMVRRLKSEVAAELPPLTRSFRWVEGSPQAKAAFQSLLMGAKSAETYSRAVEATLAEKIPEVVATCLEAGKFVCLTWRRADAWEITRQLTDKGAKVVTVTGELSATARAMAIQTAEKAGASLVATLDSVGTGVNLQRIASTGIMHALRGKPTDLAQAEARLHRLGQSNPVVWQYVVARGTIDQKIADDVLIRLDDWLKVIGQEKEVAATKASFNAAFGDSSTAKGQDAFLKAMFDSLPDGGGDGGE